MKNYGSEENGKINTKGKLGGERATITTPDEVEFDAMYLDASKFKKKSQRRGSKINDLFHQLIE